MADCDLCELHPGEADGLTWDEFRDRYGEPDWDVDPDSVVAPGGESWTGFVDRVAASALTALSERHHGELVVVVCHGGVIEASMLSFLPGGPGRGRLGLPTEPTPRSPNGSGSRERLATGALQRRRPPGAPWWRARPRRRTSLSRRSRRRGSGRWPGWCTG